MRKIIISLLILAVAGIASYYFVYKNLDYGEDYENYSKKDEPATDTNMYMYDNESMATSTTTNDSPVYAQMKTDIQIKIENKTVAIKGFAFNPDTLTIKKGAKITWTNEDSAPHTVTSDSGTFLNSVTLHQGESYSQTFDQAGTFSYHCAIHPMMKGTITVE